MTYMSTEERYLEEHFIAALEIAGNISPDITASFLWHSYREHAVKLVKCKALKKAPYLQEILVFENKRAVYKDVTTIDGVSCYYTKNGERRFVKQSQLRMYTVCFDWLLKNILYGLDISIGHRYNCIVEDSIWNFGSVNLRKYKIPLILVRCITSSEVYKPLVQYLNKHHVKIPALVLAIDNDIPEFFALPSNNVWFGMHDLILNDMGKVYFNIDLILEKMGKDVQQEGFSDGYRSAYIKGESYIFSKKQAEVLELLHKASKPMHQDEVIATVSPNANYNRISLIFSSKGKLHSAWDKIIKHDNKGYYWIEK
jgi:hypothetical protein